MEIIKITPDKEKAKSIMKMSLLIEERIQTQNLEKMAALILVDYYEIMKELMTAVLLCDGFKTLSHKDLIDYLQEYEKEFTLFEISLLDEMRILRNRISYDGFFTEPSYLIRNESFFKGIIRKLREILNKKIR